MPLNFNRSTYTQFIGYGNPNSNVWIMGREEKKPWDISLEEINDYKNISYTFRNYLEPCIPGETYYGYMQLLQTIFPENYNTGNYFITNIFPFGIDNRNIYSKEQKNLLGFNEIDDMNTNNNSFDERCIALSTFFRTYNWRNKFIFFCIGTDYEEWLRVFLENFGISIQNDFCATNNNEYVRKLNNLKIFILPHASHNFFIQHSVINTLREIISDQ